MFVRFQYYLVVLSLLLGLAVCSVTVAEEQDDKSLHVEETSPVSQFDMGKKWAILIGEDVVGLFGLARVSLRPEMVLDTNDVSLYFNIKNSASQEETKPVVADAVDELFYRSSENVRPQVLAKGTSDFSNRSNKDLTRFVAAKPSLLIAPFNKQEVTAKQAAWATHLNRKVVATNKLGMQLVLIPPGEFTMGASNSESHWNDECPQHRVQITKPFYLAATEVTQQQWKSVMGTTPWEGKDYVKEGNDYAASYISWKDARQFLKKLSRQERATYRLPSEAEWEYACRAGSKSPYCFGHSTETLKEYAWFRGNAYYVDEKYAHRVGRKLPNGFSLFDMHGNVYEWCRDWYEDDYYDTLTWITTQNPTGPSSGSSRVLRGGSWFSISKSVRSASRSRSSPSYRSNFVGFRVVRILESFPQSSLFSETLKRKERSNGLELGMGSGLINRSDQGMLGNL